MSEDEHTEEDTKQDGFFAKFSKTPCVRKSFLTGISSGVGVGLLTFLCTSNSRRSSNYGVISYAIITAVVWVNCRYKFTVSQNELRAIKRGMQVKTISEGTDLEAKLKSSGVDV